MSTQLFATLEALPGTRRTMSKGDSLFRRDAPVHALFLLERGQIALIRHQENGAVLALHRATGPAIVAEASLHSPAYHCDGICTEDSLVLAIPVATVHAAMQASSALVRHWQAYLAAELQATRHRCELLTRKTVQERLDGWLDWRGALPPKGHWKHLASDLGVTPEALYREIARRKRIA